MEISIQFSKYIMMRAFGLKVFKNRANSGLASLTAATVQKFGWNAIAPACSQVGLSGKAKPGAKVCYMLFICNLSPTGGGGWAEVLKKEKKVEEFKEMSEDNNKKQSMVLSGL